MKRLLKISLDTCLLSLTPILSWFCLSLIVDKDLIKVFTITYPIQCFYYIVRSPFAVGANISKIRDHNKNAVMSGMCLGIIVSFLLVGFLLANLDSYLNFFNLDVTSNRAFVIYSILNLLIQTIFSFILEKLYYENQNSRANKYSITFNLLNFFCLIGVSLLTKNPIIIVSLTTAVISIYTVIAFIQNFERFRFRINLLKCFKYDLSSIASQVIGFIIFLFGIRNTAEYGAEYALAFSFVSLITDTQWDIIESVRTLATVDISKKQFNIKQSLRNAYKLLSILFFSIFLMFCIFFRFYNLNLPITFILIGSECLSMTIELPYYIYSSYLQLNWSATKTTAIKISSRGFRLGISFLPTPFALNISGLFNSIYHVLISRHFFHKHFIINKHGRVSKRRTRRIAHSAPRPELQYNDLIIDEN